MTDPDEEFWWWILMTDPYDGFSWRILIRIQIHSTTFYLRILNIFDTWVFVVIKAIKDIPDHPDLPDGHHDVWHHYHSTIFHLRIPKIYYIWVFFAIKAIKNIPILGGHSWSSWSSWWISRWLESPSLIRICSEVSKNIWYVASWMLNVDIKAVELQLRIGYI